MTRILAYLEAVDDGAGRVHRCRMCQQVLGPAEEDFKFQAASWEEPIGSAQPPHVGLDSGAWVLRHFACPNCGVLLEVDMVPRQEPSPRSVELE